MVPEPSLGAKQGSHQKQSLDSLKSSSNNWKEDRCLSASHGKHDRTASFSYKDGEGTFENQMHKDGSNHSVSSGALDDDLDAHPDQEEKTVWICCDVYDTGIGIPGILIFLTSLDSKKFYSF